MKNIPAEVSLEDMPCPLGCERSDRPVIVGRDRISGVQGEFQVVECTTCGLLRTNPRPTAATIGSYYPDSYGPYHTTAGAPPAASRRPLLEDIKRLLGLDQRRLPPVSPGRLLEIGCASGSFMEEMRQKGWLCEGIEFSPTAAEVARKRGFNVQVGAVEDAAPPAQPYDVVVAWMVLEHLHDPPAVLRRVREWTRRDGYLVFSVPDSGALERRAFGNAWHAWHLPNHLYHYNKKTIQRVLDAAGWEIAAIRWQRNPGNLISSLENKARDAGMERAAQLFSAMRNGAAFGKLRLALGWFLGVARQSGRIEVWAQPIRR